MSTNISGHLFFVETASVRNLLVHGKHDIDAFIQRLQTF